MKLTKLKRLLYLAPIGLILLSLGMSLVNPVPAAAASTSSEQYAMTFDSSEQSALDNCLQFHNCDRSETTPSDLYYVVVGVKDGVYGSSPISLSYEPNVADVYMKSDQFAFTGNYTCNDLSVSLLITIDMANLEQSSYPSNLFIDNIRNNKTGDDTTGALDGADYPLSSIDINQGQPDAPTAKLPKSCQPQNLSTGAEDGGGGDPNATYSSSTHISVKNYTKLSSAEQKAWGSVLGNPAFGNPNSGSGTPSSTVNTNLVCKTGTVLGFIPNPLDWMLCGIINGMNLIVNGLDQQITNLLSIGTTTDKSDDPNEIFTDSNGGCGENFTAQSGPTAGQSLPICDAYYKAWLPFRNIALGLLVIVGLIIVTSQALGMEIIDAYTIRKMLPRVLLSAVAITLSWQLMRFAVTLSNDLGYGVKSLIEAPFSQLGINLQLGFGGSLLGLMATAIGAAFFDLFAMLSFVGTAAIAVFITFMVLILRQIAIVLLIIFSPVALIAYVLPNTQRVYKFWWESFSKMLLMFPMIVALISAGHIFAAIASNQGDSLINQATAVIAYFAPYFMVPVTFRMSGATMGFLGNAVASRGEGARNALSKFRSGRLQKNTADLKSGARFEGKRWIPGSIKAANKFGDISRGVGTGWNGRFGLGPRGENAQANVLQAAADEAMKQPGMQAIKGKNDINRVLNEGMGDERRGHAALVRHLMTGGDDGQTKLTRDEAVKRADAAVIGAKVAGGFTKVHGIAAFKNMARDGTAIRDTKDLARLAAIAGDGNGNNTFTFAAEAAAVSKQVNRPDLAPSPEAIGELSFRESDKLFNKGRARLYDPESEGRERMDDQHLETASKLSAYGNTQAYERFTQAKGRALRSEHTFLAEIMTDTTGKYSPEEKQKAAAQMADARAAIASGMGSVNKREEAIKAMGPAIEAHDAYMQQQTGEVKVETTPKREYVQTAPDTYEERVSATPAQKPETNSDVVTDRFGGRPHGVDQNEIEEEAHRNHPQEPEQQ